MDYWALNLDPSCHEWHWCCGPGWHYKPPTRLSDAARVFSCATCNQQTPSKCTATTWYLLNYTMRPIPLLVFFLLSSWQLAVPLLNISQLFRTQAGPARLPFFCTASATCQGQHKPFVICQAIRAVNCYANFWHRNLWLSWPLGLNPESLFFSECKYEYVLSSCISIPYNLAGPPYIYLSLLITILWRPLFQQPPVFCFFRSMVPPAFSACALASSISSIMRASSHPSLMR